MESKGEFDVFRRKRRWAAWSLAVLLVCALLPVPAAGAEVGLGEDPVLQAEVEYEEGVLPIGTDWSALEQPQVSTANIQDKGGNWSTVVQVDWEPVDQAERYQVFRQGPGQTQWESLGYVGQAPFYDYDVTVGNRYSYTVCPVWSTGVEEQPGTGAGSALEYPSGSCGADAAWRLSADGVLEITGTGPMEESYSMDRFPWYPLRNQIRQVTVGEGITTLSPYAFQGCTNLTQVSLPDTLTALGKYAFFHCTALKTLELPQGISEIPERAFYQCTSLETIQLPAQLTAIGKGAFDGCAALRQLELPDSVQTIGTSAFAGCASLQQLDLPDRVTELGLNTLYGCSKLEQLELPEHLEVLGPYALSGCGALTSLTLPEGVVSLGAGALRACTGLKTITFLGSCPEVGADVFPGQTIVVQHPQGDASWPEEGLPDWGDNLVWEKDEPQDPPKDPEPELPEEPEPTPPEEPELPPCATPQVSVINSGRGIAVSWKAVEGADTYRIFRWNDSKNGWDRLKDVTGLSYTDTQVTSGQIYRYTVRCLRDGQYSGDYQRPGSSTRYLAPPQVQVVNAGNGVAVTWNAVPGAGEYVVYRRTESGQWGRIKEAGAARSYTDTSAQSGVRYYYTVKAFRSGQSSDFDRTVSICAMAQPTIQTQVGGTSITLRWNSSKGAVGYRLYRKTNGGGWVFLQEVAGLSYTDQTVQSGTTYAYTVRARGNGVLSAYQAGNTVTFLTEPTVGTYNGSQGGVVTWERVGGATEYRIYRKGAGGGWIKIAIVGKNETQYTDRSVQNNNGTRYAYTVRAGNGRVLSTYSGTELLRLSFPKVGSLTGGKQSLTIRWSKNGSASGYEFQYAANASLSGATKIRVTPGSTTSKTVTGLVAGKTYYVRMRVVAVSGGVTYYSPWSSAKSITVK